MAEEQPQKRRPFMEVQQEVSRLFQELVHQPWGSGGQSTAMSWQPRCNMEETDDAIIVEVELPGVEREDVHLRIEGDVLNLSGERRAQAQHQGHNFHYLEQQYGHFERQLHLPRTVDCNAIQAEFTNGILNLTLPKNGK